MPIRRVVADYELVEVFALERIGLERKMFVRAQIVDPKLFRPGSLTRWLLVEKEDVGFHALSVEKASGQTE